MPLKNYGPPQPTGYSNVVPFCTYSAKLSQGELDCWNKTLKEHCSYCRCVQHVCAQP